LAIWAERLERGTYRFPAPLGDRLDVTPAEMAAIFEGINLSCARRQRRFALPTATPAREGLPAYNQLKKYYYINTMLRNGGMTTSADELPANLETCHQLIRELIETLRQQTSLNDRLRHQLERLLRRVYGQKAERIDPGQL